ncbi:MAG: histidine kinase [Eubacterium sp.]|nr:histidine kinase [Eubacterium sp.]
MKLGKRFQKTIHKSSLSIGMIRVIILCWLLPYLLVSAFWLYYIETKNEERISDTSMISVGNAAQSSGGLIEETLNSSLMASYDGVIRSSYEKFRGDSNEEEMWGTVNGYLQQRYKYSKLISNTKLLFTRYMKYNYETYSTFAGASSSEARKITTEMVEILKSESKSLGTDTKILSANNHIFMMRNMMTKNYQTFATLVFELNRDNVFGPIANAVWQEGWEVFVDDKYLTGSKDLDPKTKKMLEQYHQERLEWEKMPQSNMQSNFFEKRRKIASSIVNVNGQKVTIVVKLNEAAIGDNSTYFVAYFVVFIMLIPLLIATIYYFYHNINRPIGSLVEASKHIEEGEYGYQIEEFHRNGEFERLINTFNHMSGSLEDSFNRIYAEEVAARDANMKALQAQINPHFLNNTLEIINWKARLSGNEDVSKMISSLSTMMNATMNRKNEAFITIEEEMKYVDAYLYIIYARFGGKFKFTKEISEDVLECKIPRLIIQPLVENVVEHSGDIKGNMEGKLVVSKHDEFLVIRVENTGSLSKENKERIEQLLSQTKLGDSNENIGIRNVNLRLKMIYGEESGLTIKEETEGITVSEIRIQNREDLSTKHTVIFDE